MAWEPQTTGPTDTVIGVALGKLLGVRLQAAMPTGLTAGEAHAACPSTHRFINSNKLRDPVPG